MHAYECIQYRVTFASVVLRVREDAHVFYAMERVVNCLVPYSRTWRRCCRSAAVLYYSLTPSAPVAACTTNTQSRLLHTHPLLQSPDVSRSHSVATNDDNLSVGDRILKSIGWMAGFYSRKAVSLCRLYML